MVLKTDKVTTHDNHAIIVRSCKPCPVISLGANGHTVLGASLDSVCLC